MASEYDVAIVGSGCSGLTSAYCLAPDHDVIVIDQDRIGNGTSSRASGVIMTPIDYPTQPEWTENAVSFFEEFDGTNTFDFTEREYVRGVRPENVEGAKDVASRQWVELLDPDEYEKWDQTFAEDAPYEKVLVWDENTGFFDVDTFLPAMEKSCIDQGVEVRPDTTVESVMVEDDEAVGVETEYGTVEADNVVVAAGSGTRSLVEDVLPLPIRKFIWNVAYLDVDLPDGYPMGGDAMEQVYWRPTRDDHLLIGIEHHYGIEPDDVRGKHHMEFGISDGVRRHLQELLGEEVPELLRDVETPDDAVRWEVCPMADCTTPDAKPIIDSPDEGPDDLVVAAGFHGAAVMSSKSIGDAVRSYVTGEEAPFPLENHQLDRFDRRDTDFEFAPMTSWQEHMV